jgi:uncharacterized repeat protein (TIGR03803 family)
MYSATPRAARGDLSPPTISHSVLHNFHRAVHQPEGPVVSDGRGTLYGTVAYGGPSDGGAVFAVRAEGGGFRVLHEFAGGADDGSRPRASLVIGGDGALYGTTSEGGTGDKGTIFTLQPDGSRFAVLHSFPSDGSEGRNPAEPLVLDDAGRLYGTAVDTLFTIGRNGSGFRVLHVFKGGLGDGRAADSPLLLDASGTLYGTTRSGGRTPVGFGRYYYDGDGTIFRIRTDGTDFRILRAFAIVDGIDGGLVPGLATDGAGNLFGWAGGATGITDSFFRIGTDGSGYRTLLTIDGTEFTPSGQLLYDPSGHLYGMLNGSSARSELFRLGVDGTGYEILRTFDGGIEGYDPASPLVLLGPGVLCGAMAGGSPFEAGTVFRVDTDGTRFEILHAFDPYSADDGLDPNGALIADAAGTLYGMTYSGGESGRGTIFKIRPDGTGFQILHAFGGAMGDGSYPHAGLVLDRAGNLYGTSRWGGIFDRGTVFRITTEGLDFRLLHSFSGGAEDGEYPGPALAVDAAGSLYGTTPSGGPSGNGTVFRIGTDGSGFRLLHTFSSREGGHPSTPLLLDGSGNLYGTFSPFDVTYGGLFTLRTDGTGYRLLHSFAGGPYDGANPSGSLLTDGRGSLYGTTWSGGPWDAGTIFRTDIDGTNYQILHAFTGDGKEGLWPSAVLDGGNLYGITHGSYGTGTLFSLGVDGSDFQILISFDAAPSDLAYLDSLFLAGPGLLYATTGGPGGAAGFGSLVVLRFSRPHSTLIPGPFVPIRKR